MITLPVPPNLAVTALFQLQLQSPRNAANSIDGSVDALVMVHVDTCLLSEAR